MLANCQQCCLNCNVVLPECGTYLTVTVNVTIYDIPTQYNQRQTQKPKDVVIIVCRWRCVSTNTWKTMPISWDKYSMRFKKLSVSVFHKEKKNSTSLHDRLKGVLHEWVLNLKIVSAHSNLGSKYITENHMQKRQTIWWCPEGWYGTI